MKVDKLGRQVLARELATAARAWASGDDAAELMGVLGKVLDTRPEEAAAALRDHVPAAAAILAREVWDEGYDAGRADALDRSCCASASTNPYEHQLVGAIAERSYLAGVSLPDGTRAVLLAGHGHRREVAEHAARANLSAWGASVSEDFRVRVCADEPGAWPELQNDGWWAEVPFGEASAVSAVTVVTEG